MNLTPEKIEQGRKLLEQATPGPFRYDRLAIHHSITIDGKPAEWNRVVEDRKAGMFENHVMCGLASTRGKYEQEEANGKYIAWLLNNAQALLAAAELRMASRWIPVSERLPEEGVDVLCHDDEGRSFVGWYEDEGWSRYFVMKDIDAPTHWQPLPSPPDQLTGRIGTSTHTP